MQATHLLYHHFVIGLRSQAFAMNAQRNGDVQSTHYAFRTFSGLSGIVTVWNHYWR